MKKRKIKWSKRFAETVSLLALQVFRSISNISLLVQQIKSIKGKSNIFESTHTSQLVKPVEVQIGQPF